MAGRKKKRIAAEAPALADRRDVDRMIGVVADLEASALRLKAEVEEKIRCLREDAALHITSRLESARAFRAVIEDWAEAHPEEFGKARSLALPHGRIGWRTVTSIRLDRKAEFVIAALEAADLADAVIVKKSPNKDVLAAYPDETLREVGCRRIKRDDFYVEPKAETEP